MSLAVGETHGDDVGFTNPGGVECRLAPSSVAAVGACPDAGRDRRSALIERRYKKRFDPLRVEGHFPIPIRGFHPRLMVLFPFGEAAAVARTCSIGPRLVPYGQGKAADLQNRSALPFSYVTSISMRVLPASSVAGTTMEVG